MILVHSSKTEIYCEERDLANVTVHFSRELILHEDILVPFNWAIRHVMEEIKAFREIERKREDANRSPQETL